MRIWEAAENDAEARRLPLQRKILYVGRSNKIRLRYGRHCNPGATHRMAAFAFNLAREATGKTTASYKVGDDSRKGLMLNAGFSTAFEAAKARIRRMDFRFVVGSTAGITLAVEGAG